MFKLDLLEPVHIRQINLDEGRIYQLESGQVYPSITRILSELPNTAIEAWKLRMGDKAEVIRKRATDRGSALHGHIERYLRNQDLSIQDTFEKIVFSRIRPVLLERLDNIRLIENSLYSDKMRLAGTIDCLADFDGKLSIIDFKTSNGLKKEAWLRTYYAQTGAYWQMVKERYLLRALQCVIIVVNEELNVPQIFIREPEECFTVLKGYVQELVKYRRQKLC